MSAPPPSKRITVTWWATVALGVLSACDVNVVPQTDPLTTDAGADRQTLEQQTLTLTATATGGLSPYVFRWNVEVAPGDGEIPVLDDNVRSEIQTLPLDAGRHVFRVLVTDANGTIDVDFVAIEVDAFTVTVDQPDLLTVDVPGTLTADVATSLIDAGSLSFFWEITGGADADLASPNASTTLITGRLAGTIDLRVTATATLDDDVISTMEELSLVVVSGANPRVVMTVSSADRGVNGDITFELFSDIAPKTVANLLQYIDEGFYDDVLWHRVAFSDGDPFVVQCGGFTRSDDGESLVTKEPTRDPVESEADNGQSNQPGFLAMALTDSDPDSGTTQFFVNLADNAFLDDQQFTVFGEVVGGMTIVDAMSEVETGSADIEGGGSKAEVPVNDITIVSFRRAE